MKIAVLSDIHGNLPALEAVAADLAARKVDQVINLGDHASGPLWPVETLGFLMKQTWVQIAGNHDHQLVRQSMDQMGLSDRYACERISDREIAWLESLPAEVRQDYLGQSALLVHGAPGNEYEYLLETVEPGFVRFAHHGEIRQRLGEASADLLLCGHTHVARVVQFQPGMLIVNPGSVGLPGFSDTLPLPHVVEAGSPHARYAVVEYSRGGWQAELIALPYDHLAAAAQAGKNERMDWESALRTGFAA